MQRDVEANLNYITQALANVKCDLLVLPELFTCGYAFDNLNELAVCSERLSESRTVDVLSRLAREIAGVITGTIPVEIDNQLFNTAILVGEKGLIGYQNKIHLPEYEKQFFVPGDTIKTFMLPNEVKVGMMSCFDCWFPQFGSLLREQGAQILINSASFGGLVTPTILPIRARENQVFVISCNRIGAEYFGTDLEHYCGRSQIISPDGQILAAAVEDETLTIIEIDLNDCQHPAFGSLICRDFASEHQRYKTILKAKESGE